MRMLWVQTQYCVAHVISGATRDRVYRRDNNIELEKVDSFKYLGDEL